MSIDLRKRFATREPGAQGPRVLYLLRCAAAVFAKDIKCEFRAMQAVSSVLLFAVTSTVAMSLTLQSYGGNGAISSALLWLVIYFSAMSGLSRSFVREEETNTAPTLRLASRPASVYLGKLAFNWVLVTALQLVSVPLFAVFMGCQVGKWGEFIGVLVAGGLALSAGATAAAAMVARAATKGALFAVICFPLLVPALATAIHGSNAALDPRGAISAASDVRVLICYSGTVIIASLMLFKFIWED